MHGSYQVVLKLSFDNYPQCERKLVFGIVLCGHEVIHYQLYHWVGANLMLICIMGKSLCETCRVSFRVFIYVI